MPLRTKRNFKDLQLPEANTPTATRQAPKKRPPALPAEALPTPGYALNSGVESRSALQPSLSSPLAKFDFTAADFFDLKNADLRNLKELGQGNGGSVMMVEHVPTGTVMAKKVVLIDAKPTVRKRILRELQILHDCKSQYIVSSYGAFIAEPNICICMEFMDKGSFDGIYKRIGPIDIEVVALVAVSVLEGLTYLYDIHRIIHRDIKPSNILCNSRGQIKLCDFGVSGELINSIAHTFVGTSIYMSPERIQGAEYSVKSDVWSLGITLIELALGRFPFSSDVDGSDVEERGGRNKAQRRQSNRVSLQGGGGTTMSIIELMHQIVKEPAPRLGTEGQFPKLAVEFVDACLVKDPGERKTPKALSTYSWMNIAKLSRFDLKEWTNRF